MISAISKWSQSIIIAIVIGSIITMILPEGKNKKYIKMIIGVYILFTILTPVLGKKIDLSKYDRYENALNGGYKAYKKSDSEMNKLRELIESCIKEYGYTNVKIVQSSSIINNTQSFTANKTNVSNKVYDSEDFTIYYYAETEYHIASNGTESVFQNRSYIKVK